MELKHGLLILGACVLLFGGVLLFANSRSAPGEVTDRTTREITLACDREHSYFHIHPVLSIVANGERQEIPANIGIKPTCMTAIHTHTADGVIHVESPEVRDFALSDFFAVWEKPFNKDQVLDFKADATHRIRITVNGQEVDTFENTILRDQDQIVILYEAI
jgi:hypothetical protein